jgi:hypothetical protein
MESSTTIMKNVKSFRQHKDIKITSQHQIVQKSIRSEHLSEFLRILSKNYEIETKNQLKTTKTHNQRLGINSK